MPMVSVIIPTYNRAALLKETLESVFVQTYTDYEVIVIDDGSTDNTEKMVSALLPVHTQLRYLKQANTGVSAARNHGIFEARGEWIAFLDSDDLWLPDKLKKQMAFLVKHPTAGAVCHRAYRYQDGQIKKDEKGEMLQVPWSAGGTASERTTSVLPFELFASEEWVVTSSVLVRKTVLYKAGLFECCLRIDEDYVLWTKIAKYTEFWFLNDVLSCYRHHEANITNDADMLDFYNVLSKRLQMILWSGEPHIAKLYKKRIGKYFRGRASVCRAEQNYKQASRYYWRAIEYTPGLKQKIRLFAKFLAAKFFPFVFRNRDAQDKQNRNH